MFSWSWELNPLTSRVPAGSFLQQEGKRRILEERNAALMLLRKAAGTFYPIYSFGFSSAPSVSFLASSQGREDGQAVENGEQVGLGENLGGTALGEQHC